MWKKFWKAVLGGAVRIHKKQLYEELFQGSRQAPSMMKARSFHKEKTLKGRQLAHRDNHQWSLEGCCQRFCLNNKTSFVPGTPFFPSPSL